MAARRFFQVPIPPVDIGSGQDEQDDEVESELRAALAGDGGVYDDEGCDLPPCAPVLRRQFGYYAAATSQGEVEV